MKSIVAFLLLSACSALAQPAGRDVIAGEVAMLSREYAVTPIKPLGPETKLSREYYHLLNRYVRFVAPNLHDWPGETGARFHKIDHSKEHAVRQNATVAFGLAVLSAFGPFDEQLAGRTREQVRQDAISILKYLSVTHVSNCLPTGDGKQWGDHWQSALWAASAGKAAWLLWDHLPIDTRVMVARMVIHEANRFNTRPPDNGRLLDTKAEENAWNSHIIAQARCMFSTHPNAALWHERTIIYMINSFSTDADHHDETILDGKRVRDWVSTVCIHPDYTLENHRRVHPDYLSTFSLNLRNALIYDMAGLKIPAATFHNVSNVFGVLQYLTGANGGMFYINGQDWWPHRHDVALFPAGLVGSLTGDANAAAIERGTLDFMKRMHGRFENGRLWDPREHNYPNVEEEMIARYSELYLAHRLFGDPRRTPSSRNFQNQQHGARFFEAGGFVTHRTPEKFASFGWKNGAMGLIVPSDDTWFAAPYERTLVGRITIKNAKDTAPLLKKMNVTLLKAGGKENGFAFVGTFDRCEGKVEQTVAVISFPDEPVLYVERLRALGDIHVEDVSSGILAIFNEDARPITRNERVLWTGQTRRVIAGAADLPPKLNLLDSPSLNIDDRLTIIARGTGKVGYFERHTYERARLQQEIIGNHLKDVGPKRRGEHISQLVMGILPNARHTKKTSLNVEYIGSTGMAVTFQGTRVLINLGDTELFHSSSRQPATIPPLTAVVPGLTR